MSSKVTVCDGKGGPVLIPASHEHTAIADITYFKPASTNGPSSPISTLLEELLIMIFDDVITSESSCPYQRTDDGCWTSIPRSLARVSRTWRTIIFSCPKLWRHVHIAPVQSVRTLKDHLTRSSPLSIRLTVHQWPFRNPIVGSGPLSIVALATQLQSILLPLDKAGTALVPASQRIESIVIHATECSTFLNFVLQTWTGRGIKFSALRRVAMEGDACATWSRACFFDGKNAPVLDRLELSNVVIARNAYRLPWGVCLNLTTLVWAAPVLEHGSLVVSVSCFHHVVSSFPNLVTLELCEHVVALELATLGGLEGSGIVPLTHIRNLCVRGRVFANAHAAFLLFHMLPEVRRVVARGRACSGALETRTVTLALQGLICFPKAFGRLGVLPNLEDLGLELEESMCEGWKTWCMGELEAYRRSRETMASAGEDVPRVRMCVVTGDSGGV